MAKIRCPRCGSVDIEETETSSPPFRSFNCKGECYKKYMKEHKTLRNPLSIYFNYETDDDTYSWPAIGCSYVCYADELDDVLNYKKSPRIE